MRINSNRGSWTLIGLLVVAAIIFIVLAITFGKSGLPTTAGKNTDLLDKGSKKQTIVGQSLDTAKAVDCQERLRQIRLGIYQYKTTSADDENPPTLKDIGLGVSADYFQCPVSNQQYQYDQATGVVRCPTHTDF